MAVLEMQYVRTAAALAPVVEAIRRGGPVAFDTEFVSEGVYEPLLCLVQLATPDGIWIVDPLALSDLSELWRSLTAPETEVVALAAREEIRFCIRGAGHPPAHLLDPQLAAGLLGYGYPLSHTNLVRKALGVTVAGGEAFTDWRQRPLSTRQLEYAADDVRYLLPLREHLLERAGQLPSPAGGQGRAAWIEAECRRLVERVVAAEQEERWRVAGSAGMGRRDLAVLRELWRWRDGAARHSNLPPRRVLRDDLLVEIAKRKPTTVAELYALRGLDRGSARDAGPRIVAAVETALKLPNTEWPRSMRREDPPQLGALSQLVSVAANGLAAEYEVEPSLLATAADMQDLVRWRLGRMEGEREPALLEGWRGEILGRPLLQILDGQRSIRVTDLAAPNPLVFEEVPGAAEPG